MLKNTSSCYAWLVVTSLFVALTPSLMAQTATTGALTGTVKDSSGAVVPNSTVTVTNIGTSQARTTMTSTDGTYKFGFMSPGSYKMRFEASGFSTEEVPSVTITVTETAVLDQTLQVGSQTQQIEVRGETEAVQTASSTVGTVVAGDTLATLPLTSRNYTTLLGLAAGSNVGVYNAAQLGRGSQDISVNGSSPYQNNYQQDGASIVSFTGRGTAVDSGGSPGVGIVNPDAIQEFKIQTSQFDAGYGRNTGANVNVVTRSGTNLYHGTAFEFFRNAALNANDFFRKLSPAPNNTRQVLNQNQFGGTTGGPIKKDKLFFFASYQESRQKNGISPAGYSTPTLVGIPQGDRSNTAVFKAALGLAFCPATSGVPGSGSATGGTKATSVLQVACNGSNINPVTMNLLQLKNADGSYFIPSSSTGKNQNVTFSIPAAYAEHQAVGNLDYVVNSRNTLSARWFYDNTITNAPMGAAATSSTVSLALPGSPGAIRNTSQYWVAKLTSILSNNVVNEARFSVQRVVSAPSNGVPFTDTQVGIAPIDPTYNYLDTLTVTGLMVFGGQQALGNVKYSSAWEAADQISWSHGKHTIRAGFEYERDRMDWDYVSLPIGNLSFQTFQDFLLGLPGCYPGGPALCNGSSTSNLSSTGNLAAITAPGGLRHYLRNPDADAFVQDDFKVLKNLTLNLGLRWEYNGLFYDTLGQFANVWPSLINTVPVPGTTPATGTLAGFVVPSNYNPADFPAPIVGGIFRNDKQIVTQSSPSLTNFAPRAGFAWRPFASGRFVVRGGGGYFFDRMSQVSILRAAGQNQPYSVTIGRSGAAAVAASLAQPYDPTSSVGWSPRWVNFAAGTTSNLSSFSLGPIYRTPTDYQWNLNIQYEFLPRWVLEVGYVGSRGVRLVPGTSVSGFSGSERNINGAQLASPSNPVCGQGTCITTNTVANAALRVPYLGFAPGGLGADQTALDSKFNSLQVTVRKQLSYGLQVQGSYTFSRAFATDYFLYNNPNVLRYGPNENYRPQRLTVTYSYDLPFGNHEGLLGKVTSGWNIAGVTVVQDGLPQTIVDTRGGSAYGFGPGASVTSTAQFAPGMGSANVGTPGSVKQRLGNPTGYFNSAAFNVVTGPPVIGSDGKATDYGNSGFGIILGPGQFNFDATIQKTTKVGGIHEDASLVFRTEFFNMFNHAQFSNPTGSQLDVSKTTFGQITSTSVNPRLIQFALKYVF